MNNYWLNKRVYISIARNVWDNDRVKEVFLTMSSGNEYNCWVKDGKMWSRISKSVTDELRGVEWDMAERYARENLTLDT